MGYNNMKLKNLLLEIENELNNNIEDRKDNVVHNTTDVIDIKNIIKLLNGIVIKEKKKRLTPDEIEALSVSSNKLLNKYFDKFMNKYPEELEFAIVFGVIITKRLDMGKILNGKKSEVKK